MSEIQKEDSNFQPKNSKSKKKVVISIVVILIIAIVATILLLMLNESPKKLFVKNLQRSSSITEETLLKAFPSPTFLYDTGKAIESKISLSGSLTANNGSDYEEFATLVNDFIKNEKLNVTTTIDQSQEKVYLYADLEENSKKAISGEVFLDRETITAKIKEVSNKLLYVNVEDLEKEQQESVNQFIDLFFQETSSNYYETIQEIFLTAFNSTVSDNQFKKENTTIMLDGTNKACTKTSIALSEEQTKEITIKILEGIKNNEEILTLISSSNPSLYSYYTLEELREEFADSIDSSIDELKNSQTAFTIEINTYNKGRDLLRIDVSIVVYDEERNEMSFEVIMDCISKDDINITINQKTNSTFQEATDTKIEIQSKKTSGNKTEIVFYVTQDNEKLLDMSVITEYLKFSENELEADTKITVNIIPDVSSPDKLSFNFNMHSYIANTSSIEMPVPERTDINLTDGEPPSDYLEELLNVVMDLEIYKNIQTYMISMFGGYSYEDDDWSSYYNFDEDDDWSNYYNFDEDDDWFSSYNY